MAVNILLDLCLWFTLFSIFVILVVQVFMKRLIDNFSNCRLWILMFSLSQKYHLNSWASKFFFKSWLRTYKLLFPFTCSLTLTLILPNTSDNGAMMVFVFFIQAKLSVSGKIFKLTLIARRSRHYAGTRLLYFSPFLYLPCL